MSYRFYSSGSVISSNYSTFLSLLQHTVLIMCLRVIILRLWWVSITLYKSQIGLSMLIVTGTISGCGGGVLLRYTNLIREDSLQSHTS